jgi:hypothetical protein
MNCSLASYNVPEVITVRDWEVTVRMTIHDGRQQHSEVAHAISSSQKHTAIHILHNNNNSIDYSC